MKFTESSVTTQKEILKRRLGGELFEEITLDSTAFTNHVCKAGKPIDATGKKVNAESSDGAAVGILLTDVYDSNLNETIVKAFARVSDTNSNTNAGITIASGVKTSLPPIVYE